MNWKRSTSEPATGAAPVVPEEVIDRKTLANWLVETCRAFGAKRSTAHKVAGHFIEQIEKDSGPTD